MLIAEQQNVNLVQVPLSCGGVNWTTIWSINWRATLERKRCRLANASVRFVFRIALSLSLQSIVDWLPNDRYLTTRQDKGIILLLLFCYHFADWCFKHIIYLKKVPQGSTPVKKSTVKTAAAGAKPRTTNEEAKGQQQNNRNNGVSVGVFECLLCDAKWKGNEAKWGVPKECKRCKLDVFPCEILNVSIRYRWIDI